MHSLSTCLMKAHQKGTSVVGGCQERRKPPPSRVGIFWSRTHLGLTLVPFHPSLPGQGLGCPDLPFDDPQEPLLLARSCALEWLLVVPSGAESNEQGQKEGDAGAPQKPSRPRWCSAGILWPSAGFGRPPGSLRAAHAWYCECIAPLPTEAPRSPDAALTGRPRQDAWMGGATHSSWCCLLLEFEQVGGFRHSPGEGRAVRRPSSV